MLIKLPILIGASFWFMASLSIVSAEPQNFQDWKQQQSEQFSQYRTEADKAFIRYLEAEWEAFGVYRGDIQDSTPKPATVPKVTEKGLSGKPTEQQVFVKSAGTPDQRPTGFFGHALEPLVLPVRQMKDLGAPNNIRLAKVWSDLSGVNHEQVIAQLRQQQSQLKLGDWGVMLLTQYHLEKQFDDINQRIAYTWFLLNRLGYDVRISYSDSSVFLLVPTTNKIYGRSFSEVDRKKYYMYPEAEKVRLFSYDKQSRQALAALDFSLSRLIKSSNAKDRLSVEFFLSAIESHEFHLEYDLGLSEFLATYPQIDLQWYFTVPPGDPAADSLLQQLRPLIADLDERAAINLLLRFTQKLFQYQTDDQQFGKEKYLLVDESLRYGINDCEDRSIFLAWLVSSLLGLDVIALDYPGHVALAIRTPTKSADAVVTYNGQKYVVADPTFINADLGMAMPAVARKEAIVIPVNYGSRSN